MKNVLIALAISAGVLAAGYAAADEAATAALAFYSLDNIVLLFSAILVLFMQARSLLEAQKIAADVGFNTSSIATITTDVSELVRNILKYAGKGFVRFDPAQVNHTKSLRITVRDKGQVLQT